MSRGTCLRATTLWPFDLRPSGDAWTDERDIEPSFACRVADTGSDIGLDLILEPQTGAEVSFRGRP